MLAPTLVLAANYVAGVKAGDWVKYGHVTVTWSGTGTEPSYVTDQRKIDWATVEVVNVEETTVSLNVTVHLDNGTQVFTNDDLDVSNIEYSPMDNIYVIASNLKTGDSINNQTLGFPSPTINQTLTRQYAGTNRTVNFLAYTTLYQTSLDESEFYFDQKTGIMLESQLKSSDPNNSSSYVEYSMKATATNMWSPSGTTSNNLYFIIAGIVLVLVAVTAIVLIRRRKPSSASPPHLTSSSDNHNS
jgi:LPXTG-motif cell wall-anchored protein